MSKGTVFISIILFVVVHGQVKIYTDLSGSFVGPLDTFGEEALLRQSVRAYSAIATQDTLLLAMSRPHLIAIIKENPSVALFLLEQYSHHIVVGWVAAGKNLACRPTAP